MKVLNTTDFSTKWENKSKADECGLFFWETWLQKEKIQQEEDIARKLSLRDPLGQPIPIGELTAYPANQRYVIPLATLWGKQDSPASSHR